jgi:hypothetical protein
MKQKNLPTRNCSSEKFDPHLKNAEILRNFLKVPKKDDLRGKKFGRLLVIREGESLGGRTAWYCKCDCGNPDLYLVISQSLKSASTRSCGCIKKEQDRERAMDHSGIRIENYVVIKRCDGYWGDGDEKGFYECQCDCGRHFKRNVSNLFAVNSCGYCGRVKTEEITGMKFGRLTALRYAKTDQFQKRWWWFKCDCGNEETEISVSNVLKKENPTISCGCLRNEARIKSAEKRRSTLLDKMNGKRFGMLKVIGFSRDQIKFDKNGKARINILLDCVCDCGQSKECVPSALKSGRTISCGCYERGKDSYNYFLEDEQWAGGDCELYYAEVKENFHKLGISVNSDRRAPSYYNQFFYRKCTTRAIAKAVESVALRWTVKYSPKEIPGELEGWGGKTELREKMPLDEITKMLDLLFEEAEEIGWKVFWEKYLPLNLIGGVNI